MQIDVAGLRKTRAHFELQFMTAEDIESNQYPEEVLRMSARLLQTLSALVNDIEDVRNASGYKC
jgi:hypothetical protein